MSAEEDIETEEPAKKSKLPLLIGLVMALALGGGGFFAVYSGLILGHPEPHAGDDGAARHDPATETVAFVPLEPMVISLAPENGPRHLRFAAQLEVPPDAQEDVAHLSPRILDVMNGYLRAVDLSDVEDPASLIRLRAQILRRVQIVAGSGLVNDLLITEFVLN